MYRLVETMLSLILMYLAAELEAKVVYKGAPFVDEHYFYDCSDSKSIDRGEY